MKIDVAIMTKGRRRHGQQKEREEKRPKTKETVVTRAITLATQHVTPTMLMKKKPQKG